ncbi:MAG: CbiX/SirB N-terminal domain-containing protein [Gemmatimonadales bacterium]
MSSSEAEQSEITRATSSASEGEGGQRTGVLLVSHGSHSPAWRRMLLDVHAEVSAELLGLDGITEVRSAFMEYTEPSIATQLRGFDATGMESVVVVPLLLTISDHSFDDIPAICGRSADTDRAARLREEGIEVYEAEAELDFAPLLDFSNLIRTNLARRLRAIVGRRSARAGDAHRDGLVLVGYGSAEFEDEWNRFFREVRGFAESDLEIAATAHAWCGHIVRYSRQPTIDAIEELLDLADRVIVIPILVAYDQMFQKRIIGRAVERCAAPERVLYRPDAILPEPAVGRWVVEITGRTIAAGVRP